MGVWGSKAVWRLLLSAPPRPFHYSHSRVYSQFASHQQSEEPIFVTSKPHLASLDPNILIGHISLSLTYSPTSCWRLFSPLYFSWLSWILLVLLLIFTLGLILLIHPFWAVEFLYSSNLCRLCQANSCPWVSFLFAFSTHVQWSLGWRRKSWKCIGWDCSKPILCGLRLALATVLLFFYLYFLSWFCRHFLHLSRSPYHSCILHSAHELICYVLYSIQKTQLNFLIPSPPGHCTL